MLCRRSFVLIYVLLLLSVLLVISTFLAAVVMSGLVTAGDEYMRLKAECAAEAGVEWAKTRIAADPDWYTDPYRSRDGERDWLLSGAVGSFGRIADSGFKVVREEGKNSICSIGFAGPSIEEAKAISVIRVRFECPPFRQVNWEAI